MPGSADGIESSETRPTLEFVLGSGDSDGDGVVAERCCRRTGIRPVLTCRDTSSCLKALLRKALRVLPNEPFSIHDLGGRQHWSAVALWGFGAFALFTPSSADRTSSLAPKGLMALRPRTLGDVKTSSTMDN